MKGGLDQCADGPVDPGLDVVPALQGRASDGGFVDAPPELVREDMLEEMGVDTPGAASPPPGSGSFGQWLRHPLIPNIEPKRERRTKTEIIGEAMSRGEWPEAIKIAARVPRLDVHRSVILDAHLALTYPRFCR